MDEETIFSFFSFSASFFFFSFTACFSAEPIIALPILAKKRRRKNRTFLLSQRKHFLILKPMLLHLTSRLSRQISKDTRTPSPSRDPHLTHAGLCSSMSPVVKTAPPPLPPPSLFFRPNHRRRRPVDAAAAASSSLKKPASRLPP